VPILPYLPNLGMGGSDAAPSTPAAGAAVIFSQLEEPAGSTLIRIVWHADGDGVASEWLPWPLTGTLHGYNVSTAGGSATYGITIQDIYGHDVLLGDISGETAGGSTSGDLTTAISTRGDRPIVVGGRHRFDFSGDADTGGVLWLHLERGFKSRLAQAQIAESPDAAPQPSPSPHVLVGGGNVVTHVHHAGLRVVEIHWASDASGDAKIAQLPIAGLIDRLVTVPDSFAAPTTLYDITLTDTLGFDLAGGLLANRSATATEAVWPFRATAASARHQETLSPCCGQLTVSNAGASKSGVVAAYILTLPR